MIRRALQGVAGVARFLWDFVVGDDWAAALGVTALLAVSGALAHLGGISPWWLLPPGVVAVFAASVRRGAQPARSRAAAD